LRSASDWASKMNVELTRSIDSVYLGGGTPTLLAPELLAQLFDAMRAQFDFELGAEITVECAPGQLSAETLATLVAVGVNRMSLGVQSFIDRETQISGRLHNRKSALEEIRRLREAGISNLSVDLIAGLAGQTEASWEESLAVLADAGVPHASVYMLEVDEDSRLGREMLKGGRRYYAESVPSDDAIAQMYSVAIEKLKQAGLNQYEISNFSRPGFESRHNLRYWQRRPYLGLGLDASSMLVATVAENIETRRILNENPLRFASGAKALNDLVACDAGAEAPAYQTEPTKNASQTQTQEASRTDDVVGPGFSPDIHTGETARALAPEAATSDNYVLRTTTTDDLAAYLLGPQPVETAWHSPERQHEEAWFLGLRLNAGVKVAALRQEFGEEIVGRALRGVDRLAKDGLLVSDGETVRLTAQGRLLSNEVFQEFLEQTIDEECEKS